MSIHQITLNPFFGFNHSELSFSPGIQISIGVYGSGVSHLIKRIWPVWKTAETHGKSQPKAFETQLKSKLTAVFQPENDEGRVGRAPGQSKANVSLRADGRYISFDRRMLHQRLIRHALPTHPAWRNEVP